MEKYKYSDDKPWITPAFKSLVAQRQAAHKSGNTELYNKLRNQINRAKDSLPAEFYKKSAENVRSSKNWWKTVKTLLGLKTKNDALQRLANAQYDGDIDTLSSEINEFLTSVSSDLSPYI